MAKKAAKASANLAELIEIVLSARVPLPVRMRPKSLTELVGQEHLLGTGSPLQRLLAGKGATSVILYGPPGSGKTTIASLIAEVDKQYFVSLSALTAGVKEVRAVIEEARKQQAYDKQTVLFIDEVHRFSKNQQDALLAAVENNIVSLVAATTENPAFSIITPLLSRSLVLQLKPLTEEDLKKLIMRAVAAENGLANTIVLPDDTLATIIRLAAGDARRGLTILEAGASAALMGVKSTEISAPPTLTSEQVLASINQAMVAYDRNGDQHYDVISAFIKSIRGSDVDAAIHYLAKMIVAGEDPRFIARRLIILASEDIGLADPKALELAVAAAQAVQLIGLPEARINLAEATIYLALAPKSNSVITAIDQAISEVKQGKAGTVPSHLRDGHYSMANKLGNAVGYVYPHKYSEGVVAQQYPPDELVGKNYYHPTKHGFENTLLTRLANLRRIIRGKH